MLNPWNPIDPDYQIEIWHAATPRLMMLRNFLSEAECEHLVELARHQIAPSSAVDPETGEHIVIEARSSSGTYFWLGQTPVIADVEQRIADLIQLPVENGEGLQVLNYKIGQEYKPHFDFFDPNLKGSAIATACGSPPS